MKILNKIKDWCIKQNCDKPYIGNIIIVTIIIVLFVIDIILVI